MGYIFFKKSRMRDAIEKDKIEVVRTLLDNGVNPEACDDYGRSFLYIAVLHGRQDIAELLIAHGAKAEDTIKNPMKIMHLAADIGAVEMGKILLKSNPELMHLRDRRGNTPLHVAAAEGNTDFVLFLIAQGADPNAKNLENRTPLYAAQKKEHHEVVKILEHYQPPSPRPEKLPNLPPPAAVKPENTAQWRKLEGESIARVRTEHAIGYKLTEVFNFTTRERTRLYQNLETRAETVETRAFDDITEKAPLEEALRHLAASGVETGHLSIHGITKNKFPLHGR